MATASPLNRSSYAATIRPGVTFGSIADRPKIEIGRPMDASRRFEQLSRQQMRTGNLAGSAQALGMSERLEAGGFVPLGMGGRMPMMVPRDMPGPMPSPMSRPAPTPPPMGMPESAPMSARPSPMPAPMPMTPPEPEPISPFAMTPLGTYVDPTAAMVPNGFGAMNEFNAANGLPMPPPGLYGPEAPPLVDSIPIPNTDMLAPIFGGKVSAQTLQRSRPEAPLPPGMVPTEANRGGVTYKAPATAEQKIPEGIQYEKDAMGRIIGGAYPTYNAQGKLVMKRIDMDGDGVVSPQEQAQAQAGAASAAANPAARKTSSGFTVSLVQ